MYNRQLAIDYAYKWWDGTNPNFYNFDDLGGDCTNFVSQCLNAGGITMLYESYGWYYNDLNNRSPSWTGVGQFFDFATQNTLDYGVKAKLCTISEVDIGDIAQFSQNGDFFHHTMLITKKTGTALKDLYVTCHSYNAKDKSLALYDFIKIRFLKILN